MSYNTRCTECTNANHPDTPTKSARFNGFYFDVTDALIPDQPASIGLTFPTSYVAALVSLAFENTETILGEEYSS